ncbi:MAG: tetratricopeptide repeat protein [Kiritimatiellaeota bacterium]|nr:tetratricopeptide repeat protein [Kiritimatiellota bacterium]
MKNPGRTDDLRRFWDRAVFVFAFGAALVSAGCAARPPAPCGWDRLPGEGAAPAKAGEADDEEARLAGAEALCRQAVSFVNAQDVADTNALNQAIHESFRWATRLVPDNTNILEAAMFHLVDRGLLNETYDIAQAYLARNPDNHPVRYAAACCMDALGKFDVAAGQCAIIHAACPDDRAVEETLVGLYFRSGQDEKAFEVFRAAFARRPDKASKSLPVRWAIAFTSQHRDFARALQCADLALELWDLPAERSPILALMGECHMSLTRMQDAADAFCRAIAEDSENILAIQRLGMLCMQYPELKDSVDAALGGVRQAGVVRLLLQASMQQATDKPAAFETLRQAYSQSMCDGYFPGESFYLWKVMLLDAEQRNDEALVILKEAVAVHPASAEIKNCLAYLLAERNENLEEANRLINEALIDFPQNAAYLDTKGWIMFKRERPFGAIQYLLKAAELQPDEPVILDHAGDALSAVGHKADALEFWKRSTRVSPNPAVDKKLAQ